jgi:predicted PurR-regulated permease PerM
MEAEFRSRLFFVVRVVMIALFLAMTAYAAADVLLLIFAGVLVAVFLTSLAVVLTTYLRIGERWAVAVVVLVLIATSVAAAYFAAPSIAEQFDVLTREIPRSLDRLRAQIEEYSWGRHLLDQADPQRVLQDSRRLLEGVGGAFSSILGWLANFVIIAFIGLYGALEPNNYKRGFLRLIPLPRRDRIAEVIAEMRDTLKWWLIGKFFGMAVIGIFTTIGLWLLDVPLALILGLIAALLTFIPNIGPILSAVPAVLFGLTVSPQQAMYVGLLYAGIQVVESYLLTPLVQRKTIELPPALTLAAQVLLGVTFGGLGVALAAPLTAVAVVGTRMLYVEDGLEKKSTGG